ECRPVVGQAAQNKRTDLCKNDNHTKPREFMNQLTNELAVVAHFLQGEGSSLFGLLIFR
ncbi:MAG: hypothetical protein RL189_1745, partial [Pseudomonadota bacterium]